MHAREKNFCHDFGAAIISLKNIFTGYPLRDEITGVFYGHVTLEMLKNGAFFVFFMNFGERFYLNFQVNLVNISLKIADFTRTREKFCYENCFGIFRILSREGWDLHDEILSVKT